MGEFVTSRLPSPSLTLGESRTWSPKRRNIIRMLYFNHATVAVYLDCRSTKEARCIVLHTVRV
jgi:hypothetical protein